MKCDLSTNNILVEPLS